MIRILVTLMLLLFSSTFITTYAKDKEKKSEKEIKKEEEKVLELKKFAAAKTALDDMEFVIKAERLSFPNGRTINSDENTNFITASGDQTVVQIAFPNVGFGGFNGLGGITVDGRISNVKKSETKKGNIILQYSALGSSLSAQIFITLLRDSNEVTVDVVPNFSGNRLIIYGTLYPSSKSSVYQVSNTMAVPRR